ncbi:efflux RND transporter permease subunit [Desulfoluna spongiiphila]|uniref:Multidrug efflux pump subunit AcrB n=1 Tax=Desulfoluna spongiiphila TaxID=419481 RepID=A0A1G5I8T4_9BACT|nr:efflux RND transporter permease subunit [Desulfoluna spongiiphila]SCY72463.1 Multidrug efflux pump subunit AcrB [Desulfoluna spongiiphila]
MKQIAEAFARNTVFANILLVIIFLAGLGAACLMIREDFPSMTLDTVTVNLAWDGAAPEDTEEGISRKVEDAIDAVEGIDTYTTTSTEGSSATVITVKYGYDTEKVYDRVKNEIDQISTFPDEAENPVVNIPTVTFPVMTLGVTGAMGEKALKEWADTIEDELKRMPEISQVSVNGTRDYQVTVELSEESLRKYGLTLSDVATVIANSSMNLSGGKVKTSGEEFSVRTVGKRYSGEELADIVVVAGTGGESITLGQLATVKDDFEQDKLSIRANGTPVALVVVSKTEQEDAITIADKVMRYVEKKNQTLPPGARLSILSDNTTEIRTNIGILQKNGLMGLALVFVVLWLFLDTRLAFWAGMGIPISLAGGLAILWLTGYTINTVSLFGLIMVLGIVADDAIVVGEAVYVQRKKGAPPLAAAVNGLMEVGMPVLAAVATTVLAFVPLMHVSGTMGKVIVCLAVAVIACLLISLVECLILLPAHLSNLPDPNRQIRSRFRLLRAVEAFHARSVASMERVAETVYRPVLVTVLTHRYLAVCVAVAIALATVGLFRGGILKYNMFPERDGFELAAQLTFPEGTPYRVTQAAVERIEAGILSLAEKTDTASGAPLVDHMLTVTGQAVNDHMGAMGSAGANLGGVQVALLNASERGIHTRNLCLAWEQEVGNIPGVEKLTYTSGGGGPPGGDIEIALEGDNLAALTEASAEVMERLREIDGVFRIESDSAPGKNEIRFTLKPEARNLGITVKDLANQAFAAYFGKEAVKIQRGNDEVDVKVTYTEEERSTLESLKDLMVSTPDGTMVPVKAVANMEIRPGYSAITRTDNRRQVTVSADVNSTKLVAGEVLEELGSGFFRELEKKWDVEVRLKGNAEKDKEAFGSLALWYPLAVLSIYMIVAAMFRSYIQPLIILLTVPFGLIGAALGHVILGLNLSLFSVFGMVALSGVVVNDAIVLIDRINGNMKEGMPMMEAIVSGGVRRFRSVMLTSVTTVGGLLPLILETDPAAATMVPMGVSLAAGVTFATVLTLLLVPALMVVIHDGRRALAPVIKDGPQDCRADESAWTGSDT